MRVLFISQYFYPEVFKGNDIVFDFVKKGYDITVLTGKPNYPEGKFYKGYSFFGNKREIINGVEVVRTPIFPRGKGGKVSLLLNYCSFVFFSYFTILFRLNKKFDFIFVQQLSPVTMAIPGLWMKKKQNIPLFVWVLDLWPESLVATTNIKGGIIIKSINKLVKRIYEKSDIIFISSKLFKKSIIKKCLDANQKIKYLPNWAEDVFENSELIKPESKVNFPEGFNIMFAGNVGESHGFESIVEAAILTQDENINWLVVGDGRKADWLKKEIIKKRLRNVYMLGRHPLYTMPYFFSKADAMLVSLKDEAAFELTVPAKVQAYMASGKVILGMLNGEGNELINYSKSGYAVNAEDYNALADKAIMLSKLSEEEKSILEKNSKQFYIKNFKKEKLFSELDIIFKQTVERK